MRGKWGIKKMLARGASITWKKLFSMTSIPVIGQFMQQIITPIATNDGASMLKTEP